MKRLFLISRLSGAYAVVVLLVSMLTSQALLADVSYSQRGMGGVGLMQMPSARMSPEGEFTVFYSHTEPYGRGGFVAQPYEWLEVLFRYTEISNRLYGASIAGDQSFKDKGIDFKVRLLQESYYLPAISLGMQDFGGTGLFSGEYIVASKQVQRFDFSVGIGWGYLGKRGDVKNPLSLFSGHFNVDRANDASLSGAGKFSKDDYFTGRQVGLFAGIEYRFENLPLAMKLEVDSNDYQDEGLGNRFQQKSPFNIGLVYSPTPGFDLQLGFERGTELMLGVSLATNFERGIVGQKKILDPLPIAIKAPGSSEISKQSEDKWAALSQQLASNAGWRVSEISESDQELVVRAEQVKFPDRAQALGRAARILNNETDARYQWFSLVEMERGMALNQLSIAREPFARLASGEDVNAQPRILEQASTDGLVAPNALNGLVLASPIEEQSAVLFSQERTDLSYGISPGFTQSLGGPDGFILYQLRADFDLEYSWQSNRWLSGQLVFGLADNFDKFDFTAPSNLPRVRTHIREYLTTSDQRLEYLQLTGVENLGADWFAMGYAGYLEAMYAGLGGELLYRPYGKRWALGMDMNYVRQRAFDMAFGLREYGTLTGHAAAYYDIPWIERTVAKISAGRYLAKDLGVTFDVSKTFSTGVSMGAWVTLTNVSSEEFGEGSFDKGFYLNLPLDLFFLGSTKQRVRATWNFLTRDGGQRLARKYQLYALTGARDNDAFYQSIDSLLE